MTTTETPQTTHGTVTLKDGSTRRARHIVNPTTELSTVLYDAKLRSGTYRTAPAAIAATFTPAECASCGATDTKLTERSGDIVCDDAGTCVDRRNAEIIDEAHAEALAQDAAREAEHHAVTGETIRETKERLYGSDAGITDQPYIGSDAYTVTAMAQAGGAVPGTNLVTPAKVALYARSEVSGFGVNVFLSPEDAEALAAQLTTGAAEARRLRAAADLPQPDAEPSEPDDQPNAEDIRPVATDLPVLDAWCQDHGFGPCAYTDPAPAESQRRTAGGAR